MQNSVPTAGTVRVVTRRIEESVGHVAEFAAPLVFMTDALATPKRQKLVSGLPPGHKRMTNKDLEG